MKKLLLIFAFLFPFVGQLGAQQEKLNQLFEKYQEAEGVTSIRIAKPMFSMLNKLNIADEELAQIKPLLSKIQGLKILLVEKPEKPDGPPAPGTKMPMIQFEKLQMEIANSLKNMNYEELITVHSKENKIKFLSGEAADGILNNLLLSINSPDSTVFMLLEGKISIDDVNKLIEETEKTTANTSSTFQTTATGSTSNVRTVGKFSGISVQSGITVNFTQGKNQSVIVETDPGLEQYVSTEVQSGILVITLKNKNQNLNFRKLLVTVEAPHLSSVEISSGARFSTMNVITEDSFAARVASGANLNARLYAKKAVALDISSGASMRLDVQTRDLSFEGTSGSMATLTGSADKAQFRLTSAAALNAQNLITKNASGTASSGSNIKMNAAEKISAQASTGASIRYSGNPALSRGDISESGGGTVKPIN